MNKDIEVQSIPYIVYESTVAKHERSIKRLIAVLVTMIVLLFASNMIWLYAWMQYDYVESTETVNVDGRSGTANYVNGVGSIWNG